MTEQRFYGKYRGQVANNIDPTLQGRIQVTVPSVLGSGRLSWAMPCVPYADMQKGFFFPPPIGGNVWIEFEGGDPDYPIWSGCFWGMGEAPGMIPQQKVFSTDAFALNVMDIPGAARVELSMMPPGAAIPITVACDPTGVTINAGPGLIKINGITININDGALEVT